MLSRSTYRLIPIALWGVAAPDAPGKIWYPSEADPVVDLRPVSGRMAGGWCAIAIDLGVRGSGPGLCRISMESPSGTQHIVLYRPVSGRIRGVLQVPRNVSAIRLRPHVAGQPFSVGAISLTEISKVEAAVRMVAALRRRRPDVTRILVRRFRSGGMHALNEWLVEEYFRPPPLAPAEPLARDLSPEERYRRWLAANEPMPPPPADPQAPLISFLVTTFPGTGAGSSPGDLEASLNSLAAQGSDRWQAVIGQAAAGKIADGFCREPPGGQVTVAPAEGWRALAAQAHGEFIAFLDAGDRLVPGAVAAIAARLAADDHPDVVYSDEDCLDGGGRRGSPYLKPEWSPELLEAFNYFGRLTVLRRSLVPAGGAASEWEVNRQVAGTARRIVRLPIILCHRQAAPRRHPLEPVLAPSWPGVSVILSGDGPMPAVDYPSIELLRAGRDWAARNEAARRTSGELLLFLDAGLVAPAPEWLAALVGMALRPGIAVVGPLLLDAGGLVRQAGLVLGLGGDRSAFRGASPAAWGIFGSAGLPRNVSAVPATCLMVPRAVFDALGGFDETFRTAGADIALCLRARQAGWRVAVEPRAGLVFEGELPAVCDGDGERLAAEFRDLGLTEDPFYHPALAAALAIPGLAVDGEPTCGEHLRDETARLLRSFPTATAMDLCDGETAWQPIGAVDDLWAAARCCIDLLRGQAALRERFPHALSDGVDGPFARWLQPQTAAWEYFAAAFAAKLGRRPRQAFLVGADLKERYPLGLTPAGRRDFLGTLFLEGGREFALRPEEIWWFALESAEDPAGEMRRTYLFTPRWQAELARLGPERFGRWLAAMYGLREPWADPASWPTAQGTAGVNLLGHFCYPSGLRTATEFMAEGLRRAGVALSCRDVRTDYAADDPCHADFSGLEMFDTTLIHVQPEPYFDDLYRRAGLAEQQPRPYRIGYWYWELDSIPPSWRRQADQLDEIWAATDFVAAALRATVSQPVRLMTPGVELPAFQPLPGTSFGLAEDRFTFLFVFHMMSIMERKNPLGLIRAFRRAFAADEPVSLVLKTSFGARHPMEMQNLQRAADAAGVQVIDAVFTQGETLALMNACDCYVSLHRSEGFGLTLAEAMLLGKPVIATGYSGNTDFMDPSNSLLVDHTLVRLTRDYLPYKAGSRWAEPSLDDAARLMRQVYENQDWARRLGEKGRLDLEQRMSPAAAGRRMAARLAEIRVARQSAAKISVSA